MHEKLFFYLFASVALLAAAGVVFSKHLIRSVLWLVLAFIATAVLWLLLKAELLAFLLALIYVGAVIILFIFVIMLFDLKLLVRERRFSLVALAGIAVAGVITSGLCYVVAVHGFAKDSAVFLLQTVKTNEVIMLSKILFTIYLFPIAITGMLLLAAIVAAIGLTVKGTKL